MVYTITLGFCPARILEASLENYYATRAIKDSFCHVLLDQHYPIEKEANRTLIKALCSKYGIKYVDAGKNLGLHEGFNLALRSIDLNPEDKVIAFDPDSYPESYGWDEALCDALDEKEIGWATVMNPRCEEELRKYGFDMINRPGKAELWITRRDIVNSTCAWRGDFLIKSKGLIENRPFYGHLEAPMWAKLQEQNLKWAFLYGFKESDHLRFMHDREYVEYKWAHAHLKEWDGDFESWLAAGKPLSDRAPVFLP